MPSIWRLSTGYNGFPALTAVDIEAAAAVLTIIFAPNGAGKTILMKAVIGLLPLQGEVRLGDSPIERRPVEAIGAGIALVVEGRQLFGR